jgi:hypothetical protein
VDGLLCGIRRGTDVKLHLHFKTGDMEINEIVDGSDSEEIVKAMQARVAKEAGFLVGAVIKNMTPLNFAREVTRRYNTALQDDAPMPESCEAFVQMGIAKKFATVVEG